MKPISGKTSDKLIGENSKRAIAKQMVKEVELLKQLDPDKELKEEVESASIHDLQKYLND